MCGISGYFTSAEPPPPEVLSSLVADIAHRGPDDNGFWISPDRRTGLGHRRLSIIDLSECGHQPMASASGRFEMVFNGEIYNFLELRQELAARGRSFRGTSDTEVMLTAFEEWGVERSIERLNGMFAAALTDTATSTLYLFRDRLGVKPLYYQWSNGVLYFSSELSRSFARLSDRSIDRDSVALYLRHGYVPAPFSIYRSIRKLMPGTIAVVTPEAARSSRFLTEAPYWSTEERIRRLVAERDESMTLAQATYVIEAALQRSIEQRMISDVPLGAFLSGGIDSSLVVSHMQKASRAPVRTFTIGFSDADSDESRFAAAVARHLGTDHTELRATEADALEVIPRLPAMFGEPFGDSSQIPTFLVSRLTRQSITAALSGDGGDELFAGYRNYTRMTRLNRYVSLVPASAYRLSVRLAGNVPVGPGLRRFYGEPRYESLMNALRSLAWRNNGSHREPSIALRPLAERMALGSRPLASAEVLLDSGGNATEDMMARDLVFYLPGDILTKVDRCSMAVSLEVRAPFVDDFEVFDAAWRIPFRHKADGKGAKIVLREALARHIPRQLFERPKKGFAIPLRNWLNGPLRAWTRDSLGATAISRQGLLDPVSVQNVIDNAPSSEWYTTKLWYLSVFQNWLTDFHGSL